MFVLFIAERFIKLTQIMLLRRITRYDTAITFNEHCMFQYGYAKTTFSDIGSHFVATLPPRICQIIGVRNMFATTYHPKCIGPFERFNRARTDMLV